MRGTSDTGTEYRWYLCMPLGRIHVWLSILSAKVSGLVISVLVMDNFSCKTQSEARQTVELSTECTSKGLQFVCPWEECLTSYSLASLMEIVDCKRYRVTSDSGNWVQSAACCYIPSYALWKNVWLSILSKVSGLVIYFWWKAFVVKDNARHIKQCKWV